MSKDLVKELEKQIVHTTSLFKKDEEFKDDRFMRVRIAAMHSGINRNKSRFSKECIENAKNTFANIPILADVREYEDENGNKYLDYSGHSMHIETDAFDSSKERLIYDEQVVGIVPETNNFELILDEETQNYYAWIDALLYRDYGNYVCDILESRGNQTEVSMEIGCDDISFSATDKCLDVGEMTAYGLTLLGEHVTPGMAKAHAEVFSITEDSKQSQLIKIMQELKESLDNYTNTTRKEELFVENEIKLEEEVTETMEETVEEVTEESTEEVTVTEEISEETTEESPEVVVVEEKTETEEFSKESLFQKLFEISFEDIHYSLNALCSIYRNNDEWCYVTQVYDGYFIMEDWDSNKFYKQSYTVDGDNVALSGERIEMFRVMVTESEKIALEEMRANYSLMESELEKYHKAEEKANKQELMASSEYSAISKTEEFAQLAELVNTETDEMTFEDLKVKVDEMLLNYAKAGKLDFSTNTEKPVSVIKLPVNKKGQQKSRYGSLKFN